MVKQIYNTLDPYDIEYCLTDGRLIIPAPDNRKFRDRDILKKVNELGRPLTDDEAKEFEIFE